MDTDLSFCDILWTAVLMFYGPQSKKLENVSGHYYNLDLRLIGYSVLESLMVDGNLYKFLVVCENKQKGSILIGNTVEVGLVIMYYYISTYYASHKYLRRVFIELLRNHIFFIVILIFNKLIFLLCHINLFFLFQEN